MLVAPSPLANIAATWKQIQGGRDEQAIRAQQYRNMDTSAAGVRSQLQAKLAAYLRNRDYGTNVYAAKPYSGGNFAPQPDTMTQNKYPWEP